MKKTELALFLLFLSFPAFADYQATPAKGVAMHGTPRYGWNFKNFDYVNPDAPKGGTLKMSAYGSFDTFNPYVIKGVAAAGTGLLFDTLTVESADEPFSEYGLIAETIEMPKDRSWVAFNINKKARFSDGTPVTVMERGNLWSRIQAGERVGYMLTSFLKMEKEKATVSLEMPVEIVPEIVKILEGVMNQLRKEVNENDDL